MSRQSSAASSNKETDYEYESDYEYIVEDDEDELSEAASEEEEEKKCASSAGKKRPASESPLRSTSSSSSTSTAKLEPAAAWPSSSSTTAASAVAWAAAAPVQQPQLKQPGLGLLGGCVCVHCRREQHAPVRDCDTVATWVQQRQELPTVVPPQLLQRCVDHYIATVARRLGVTVPQAGVLCRRGRWNWFQIGWAHQQIMLERIFDLDGEENEGEAEEEEEGAEHGINEPQVDNGRLGEGDGVAEHGAGYRDGGQLEPDGVDANAAGYANFRGMDQRPPQNIPTRTRIRIRLRGGRDLTAGRLGRESKQQPDPKDNQKQQAVAGGGGVGGRTAMNLKPPPQPQASFVARNNGASATEPFEEEEDRKIAAKPVPSSDGSSQLRTSNNKKAPPPPLPNKEKGVDALDDQADGKESRAPPAAASAKKTPGGHAQHSYFKIAAAARVVTNFFRGITDQEEDDTQSGDEAAEQSKDAALDSSGDNVEENSNEAAAVVDSTTATCPICFDVLPTEDMCAMECGHAFCLDCWQALLRGMLSETHEVAMLTTCPTQDCQATVNEVLIEKVAPELLPRFYQLQRDSFVQGNFQTVRWCPGADCNQAALKPRENLFEDGGTNFLCEQCHTNFCFYCGLAPHEGECQRDVQALQEINDVAGLDLEAAQLHSTRDDKARKQCPKCNVWVEKTGGCNRMVCKCRHPFCWLCLGDYTSYGSHFCGQTGGQRPPHRGLRGRQGVNQNIWVDLEYLRGVLEGGDGDDELDGDGGDDAAAKIFLQKLKELDRYAHFYNRYFAHGQGQRFAEQQCPCLVNRVENYTQMAGFKSGAETDFIRSANEMLVASRRLLKYAYCSVYHSKRIDAEDNDNSHLGFLHLERLERFTEELSEVSENALSRTDRKKTLDLIAIVAKCMEALDDFEVFESSAHY